MLFDFQAYIADLREKAEKKQVVEKYEKAFGPITGDIADQQWYAEYVSQFASLPYSVPEELADDFDRDMLMQLVVSSFSSESTLDKNEDGNYELVISVKSGDQTVVKKVSELRSFQVLRLYEIYIEEQMNLAVLMTEEEKEKEAIIAQRNNRSQRRKLLLDNLDKEELTKAAAAEKEEKLDDLYSQL
ncbi:MAG: hypothetical protein H6766_01300 [Candidatus Peribacteria bacterium]|nr:MAG: hypothetical protein H6766_01300 [Candidatus Peribacteria bacterium]